MGMGHGNGNGNGGVILSCHPCIACRPRPPISVITHVPEGGWAGLGGHVVDSGELVVQSPLQVRTESSFQDFSESGEMGLLVGGEREGSCCDLPILSSYQLTPYIVTG